MDLKKSRVSPKLCVKQKLLHDSLKKFYKKNDRVEILETIINGSSKLSLRIIDWFVTNYSKKNTIILYRNIDKLVLCEKNNNKAEEETNETNETNEDCEDSVVPTKKTKKNRYKTVKTEEQFNVYLKYKAQLKAYSKKHFDPFCRRDRINFYYNDNNFWVTTIGQLNFFRWALDYNILDYIQKNIETIEADMNKNIKRDCDFKETKKSKKKINHDIQDPAKKRIRKKRRELSCSATNTLNKHKLSITLEFE
jgi:hypothetical protein